MSKKIVLDSFALLTFFQKEPGWEKVKSLLYEQSRKSSKAFLNIINWGEFYYITHRRLGSGTAVSVLELVEQLPIEIVPADFNSVRQAAQIKASYPISYADAFAAATAIEHKAAVLTNDPEFQEVEKLVGIEWIK